MRKYLSLLIGLLFSLTSANAQYVTIPDQYFRDALKLKYPGCFNSANQLDTTCAAVITDTSLRITGVPILPGDIFPTNAQDFEGLQYFKKLKALYIGETLVKKIPRLAVSLKTTLRTLIIWNNPFLDSVPPIPDSVQHIQFFLNSLDYLPPLPSHLIHLDCMKNQLTALPPLPSTLVYLLCSENNISIIPPLPSSLIQLTCSDNNISLIPPLPNKLLWLECTQNNITSLPSLPSSLTRLGCGYNNISNLPSYPDSLRELWVDHNPLLASLQANFPTRLNSLNVDSSGILCLPYLPPSLTSLYLDTTIVHCIPNTFNSLEVYQKNNGHLISYPRLCNVTNNINGCTAFPVALGNLFYDINSNGVREMNEPSKPYNKIQLSNGSYTFSNDSGYYEAGTTVLGALTVTPANTFFNVAPPTKTFNFISYDTSVIQNFAYQPTNAQYSIDVSLISYMDKARPGGIYWYDLAYQNTGSANVGATSITMQYDSSHLIFDSASNATVVKTGNILTLQLPSFPIGGFGKVKFYTRIKTNAVLGDIIRAIAKIVSATFSDRDSTETIIKSAFDPNDKTATPKITTTQVAAGNYIDYIIRYQNTGTDTAYHIVITDTLTNLLQSNTFEMLGTSHQCKTTVKGNTVSFEMRNILLPDSNHNEAASHGFVRFKVKPMSSLAVGNVVNNKASIYFDYNSPVVTNTAATQIISQTFPLTLLSIKGYRIGDKNILLYWTTANEIDTRTFLIEQSSEGRIFSALGEKRANGFGNNSYNFSIANAPKIDLYFRLKMVDKDGAFTYSPVVFINAKMDNASFTLQQNPVSSEVILNIAMPALLNTEATIANNTGAVLKRFMIRSHTQRINVEDLPVGVYYVHTLQGNAKLLINR